MWHCHTLLDLPEMSPDSYMHDCNYSYIIIHRIVLLNSLTTGIEISLLTDEPDVSLVQDP